jgi:membrane protein
MGVGHMTLLNPRTLFQLLKETVFGWSQVRAPRLGAALAYYTIFALAPLLVIVLAVAGLCFGREAIQHELSTQLHALVGRQGGEAIEAMVAAASKPRTGIWATIIAFIMLAAGATGVFAELQDSLNTIWNVKRLPGNSLRHFIRTRLLSFAMIVGIGFLLLVSLILSAILSWFGRYLSGLPWGTELIWQVINFVISLGVIALLFMAIFKVLPDVRIRWRDAWWGGLLTAVLFNIGKFLFGIYLGKSSVTSVFGAAGSLVVVLLWVYYSAQILFFGALFTRAYVLRSRARVEPAKGVEFVGAPAASPAR